MVCVKLRLSQKLYADIKMMAGILFDASSIFYRRTIMCTFRDESEMGTYCAF